MIGPPVYIGEARSHDELIQVMSVRKETLGLSNAWIEHAMNLADGHCDKILGPARERGLSQLTIDGLLAVLALKLIVVEDETATARMRARWEGRDQRQVRPPARIAASLIKRARPVVMKEAGRAGGRARWRAVNPRLRGRLMSELAKLRWNAKRSALAPEPQQKPAGAP